MTTTHNGKSPESDIIVQGYCVHCRTHRQMQSAIQVCNRRGRHDLKGHCAICGKSMYRLGGWDTVIAPQDRQPDIDAPQTETL